MPDRRHELADLLDAMAAERERSQRIHAYGLGTSGAPIAPYLREAAALLRAGSALDRLARHVEERGQSLELWTNALAPREERIWTAFVGIVPEATGASIEEAARNALDHLKEQP